MMWPALVLYLLIHSSEGRNVTLVKFQTDGVASMESMLDAGVGRIPSLTQVTVCLHFRLLHGGKRVPVVSYVVQGFDNELLIGLSWNEHSLYVECCRDMVVEDLPLVVTLYTWQHLCVALDLIDGTLTYVFNGELNKKEQIIDQSKMRGGKRVQMEGGGRLTIGQELESLEGDFDITQAMDGEIADYKFYNVILTPEEMVSFTTCRKGPSVSSNTPLLTLNNGLLELKGPTTKSNISEYEICKKMTSYLILIPKKEEFEGSVTTCEKLKGTLALPKNAEDNVNIVDKFQHFSSHCEDSFLSLFWAGAKGNVSTGQWVQLTDGEPIPWHNFSGSSSPVRAQHQCITVFGRNTRYFWDETPCSGFTTSCPLCNFTSRPLLRLRGLCQSTWFDRELYLNDYENERPKVDGALHSRVVWDNTSWVMVSRRHQGLKAVMYADTSDTFPIGLRKWTISGDKCAQRQVELLLTLCSKEEFTCKDGTCIHRDKICNSYNDCLDHSDELNCEVIKVPRGYSEDNFPPSFTNDPLSIYFLINITSIRIFDLTSFTIAIDAIWHTKWNDSRLTFTNLQTNYQTNKARQWQRVWMPMLQVTDGTKSLVKKGQRAGVLYVIRRTEPLLDDEQMINEDHRYSGDNNTLMHQQQDTLEFKCHCDLRLYPFDTQRCYLVFRVQDLTHTRGALLKVELELSNQYRYYLANVFLPSFMLSLVCCLTFCFDLDDFTDRIMVTLTSMLVLAGFFAQTSQSNPKTSYLKLIDVWYLVLICEVFGIIVALVYVENLRLGPQNHRTTKIAPYSAPTANTRHKDISAPGPNTGHKDTPPRSNTGHTGKLVVVNRFLVGAFLCTSIIILICFCVIGMNAINDCGGVLVPWRNYIQ
ncbi:Glutamate-gated chloride channel-like 8 [Homarus americanus]|uniref:Glutamate-gated chloride channel-like 8 n=1 Tax=Homarus americanus TaxID=6706 RepID=A0A8J5JMS3_HOMAM|nr:Glutamate-gated chloride channel-like 8 [Homarus americanus]